MRILMALVAVLFSITACAADDAPVPTQAFEEGKHYRVLAEPVRTDDANKIEVRELFAYTCSHCFRFDSGFKKWKAKQSEDVNVVQTPVVWAAQMEQYARAFYTAKALGILEKAHMDIFNALHIQKRNFQGVADWADFFVQYGVDKDKVVKTFDSFGISSQIKQGDAKVRAYKITGTPELVVDGKYRISSRDAGSHEAMLEVADFLIEKIRKER